MCQLIFHLQQKKKKLADSEGDDDDDDDDPDYIPSSSESTESTASHKSDPESKYTTLKLERRRIIKQAMTFNKFLNNIINITPPLDWAY